MPSSIYSWSISHILEHEFFWLGPLGSKGKKWIWGFLSNFWGWFWGQKKVQNYCRIRAKKLHSIKVRNNKISILVKSRFNPELLYKVIVYWTGITWFHETQTFQFFFFFFLQDIQARRQRRMVHKKEQFKVQQPRQALNLGNMKPWL